MLRAIREDEEQPSCGVLAVPLITFTSHYNCPPAWPTFTKKTNLLQLPCWFHSMICTQYNNYIIWRKYFSYLYQWAYWMNSMWKHPSSQSCFPSKLGSLACSIPDYITVMRFLGKSSFIRHWPHVGWRHWVGEHWDCFILSPRKPTSKKDRFSEF